MKEPAHTAEETPVAIALIRRGDCFLVGVRRDNGPLAGCAEFPGGKCRPGESPEDCIIRECREETGLKVTVLGRRREIIHNYPHGRLRLTFIDCETHSAAKPAGSFRWVPRSELVRLKFPDANGPIIHELSKLVNQDIPEPIDSHQRILMDNL